MRSKLVLALAVFVACDVLLGTIAFRLLPERIDEARFRIPSPVYHHDLRPGYRGTAQWGSFRYPIRINSLGMKDAAAREVPPLTKKWRILLLGDSFTEGVGFAYEDTFAGLIASRLEPQGVEVLNGGVVSYSPTIYERKARWLIEEAGIQIDEVVVFLDISDIEDEASHYELDTRGNVVDRDEQAVRFHAPVAVPTPVGRLKRMLREHSLSILVLDTLKDRLTDRGTQPTGPVATNPNEDPRDPLKAWQERLADRRGSWTHDPEVFERYGRRGLERATQAVQHLREFLDARGKALTLVVYPWPHQVVARDHDSIQERHWRDWCAQHGVAFVDLFPIFIDDRDPAVVLPELFIKGDVHLSAAGNLQVATAFLENFQPRASTASPDAVSAEPGAQRDEPGQ